MNCANEVYGGYVVAIWCQSSEARPVSKPGGSPVRKVPYRERPYQKAWRV